MVTRATTNYYKATKIGFNGGPIDAYEFFHGDLVGARRAYDAIIHVTNQDKWVDAKISVYRAVVGVPHNVAEIVPAMKRFDRFGYAEEV